MFRESDYVAPKLHATYSKVTPAFQRAAQAAPFEGNEKSSPPPLPDAIPSTQSVFYDPSHPRADWTGLVSKDALERRHVHNESNMRRGICASEVGFVTSESTLEATNMRFKKAQANISDAGLIGGIADNVNTWKSNNQRLFEMEPTNRDQLTLSKRTLPRRNLSGESAIITSMEQKSVSVPALHGNNIRIGNTRSMYANIGAALVTNQQIGSR